MKNIARQIAQAFAQDRANFYCEKACLVDDPLPQSEVALCIAVLMGQVLFDELGRRRAITNREKRRLTIEALEEFGYQDIVQKRKDSLIMKHNIDDFDMIIFGDFGVLTNTPFRDKLPLHLLEGRKEFLAHLREERATHRGLKYFVAGIKAGVAFGLQTEEQGTEEVRWTAEQIGADGYVVCFAHPTPAPGFEHYAAPELLADRKPNPGMFERLIRESGVARERVLVVGNYADDCRAAKAAGLAWEITGVFFADAERYTGMTPAPQEKLEPIENFDPFLFQSEEK